MEKVICLASNNAHKLEEISKVLGLKGINVKSLKECGISEELPEDGDTLEANAAQKAEYVYNKYGITCLSDDSGLEIDALNGRPGVHSAHYSGSRSAEANIQKVLEELNGHQNRSARFRTVLAEAGPEGTKLYEGSVKGVITEEPKGAGGFGYDPIFVPEGESRTFAEMSSEEKNGMSHRSRALEVFFTSNYM